MVVKGVENIQQTNSNPKKAAVIALISDKLDLKAKKKKSIIIGKEVDYLMIKGTIQKNGNNYEPICTSKIASKPVKR